jgi:virulence-associated protein VapD
MEDNTSELLKKLFALELKEKLLLKYKNLPSAEKIARDIKTSSKSKHDPHCETVRKWLKGDTFPDLQNLVYLMDWLDLNMTRVFETFKNSHNIKKEKLSIKNYAFISIEDVKNIENILLKIKIANPELMK